MVGKRAAVRPGGGRRASARPWPPPAAVQVDRALVVDDNFDVAESLTWMLEGLAREAKMAHSGPAAIEASGQ